MRSELKTKDKTAERWKDIKGYEGYYQVSSLGRVRSMDRVVVTERCLMRYKSKIRKLSIGGSGYLMCTLCNIGTKTFNVHSLVAEAFLTKIDGFEVDHIDGNKLNNILSNLRYVTHRSNVHKSKLARSSKYMGVGWHKIRNKWTASIYHNKRLRFLGYFDKEKSAAEVYSKYVKNHNL